MYVMLMMVVTWCLLSTDSSTARWRQRSRGGSNWTAHRRCVKKHLQQNWFSCEYWLQPTRQRFWCLFFQSSASWFAIAATFSLFLICLLTGWFRNISFILIHCKEFKIVFFLFIYLVTNFSRQWKVSTHDNVYLPFIFLFFLFLIFLMVFFVFAVYC